MPQPIPYLAFDGTCAEAMRFYAKVLHGTLGMMTNRQSPFADRCPPEHLDRVAHARLGGRIVAGEVRTGTERSALGCQHDDATIGVRLEGLEGVGDLADQVHVEKIVWRPAAEAEPSRRLAAVRGMSFHSSFRP